jgi:hypothetical protein
MTIALLLVIASCGDDAPIEFESTAGGTDATTAAVDPFEEVVSVILDLPPDDVFVLLDSLDDEDYFALIDQFGIEGDVEFVDTLDYDMAAALADGIDDDLYDDLLALAGTGLDPSAGSPVTSAAPTEDPPPQDQGETPSAPNASADVRRLDGGALGTEGTVIVEIGPGDISFLAFARTGDPEAQVFVTGVVSPSGVDVGDAVALEYAELSNFGESAIYVPIREEVELEVGEYEVSFEATDAITSSGALVRSGSPDGPQALDVVFWMATNEQYDIAALETRFRQVGDELFGRHGITIGTMSFITPPADVIDRYAVLQFTEGGSDADLRGLCRTMSSSVGDVRALNFAIVDRLDGDDPDAIIEGSASGLPGTAMVSGSDLSCVAGMASPDPVETERDLFERAIVIWHEAGHHLGLYHTSEGDGLFFDLLDDTPECRYEEQDSNDDGGIDLFECAGLDGDNFMFYDGDGTTMTADQAWMVRRHPLLYPVEG